MKKILSVIVIWIVLTGVPIQTAFSQEYILGPGDVLSIGVYGHEELQMKDLVVRSDGKIAFPIVGEVQAGGLSILQLTERLAASLSDYVKQPTLLINIEKYRTTRVYVLGEVPRPGMYEIEKQHNLLDALGMAGGFSKNTAKKKVIVIHKDDPNHPLKVNLLNLLEHADMTQNVVLYDGDVVYFTRNHKFLFPQDLLLFIGLADQIDDLKD